MSTTTTTRTSTTISVHIPSTAPRKTMSITQTYFLAHKARAKLSREAARPAHNLRLLVGHANMLDSLMLDLAAAEREQESWFNQSVRGASKTEEKHVRWADSIVEEPEQDWHAEDAEVDDDESSSDSDSDFDDYESQDDVEMTGTVGLRRLPSTVTKIAPTLQSTQRHAAELMDEDDEDFAQLALTRSPSHSASPPELDHDLDSSEDEAMPPSPPTAALPTFSTGKQQDYYDATAADDKDAFYAEGFYLPPRNPARLVSAISVY